MDNIEYESNKEKLSSTIKYNLACKSRYLYY